MLARPPLSTIFLVCIPLILSAYTHLWNPIGFPSMHVDEGHYMRRAMGVVNGLGPQDEDGSYTQQYDHPYFGQIFLGAVLSLIGYPDSFIPSAGNSIQPAQSLNVVPRVIMGIFVIIDTILIYKITEQRYNRRVAFIAAIIFAVMPFGWMLRRIFLEPISLPLVLLSILFADSRTGQLGYNAKKNNILLVLHSGIFLGLAVFTKIPLLAMIPLVGFLIYFNSKNLRLLGLWFIPVILIPLIWPIYALSIGDLDKWSDGILWQADRRNKPLSDSMYKFYELDPILFLLGLAGLVYAAVKKDIFPLLWAVPSMVVFAIQDFSRIYFFIPLFPAFCISAASLLQDLSDRIGRNKKRIRQLLPIATISIIAIFGLISTTMLVTTNLNSSFFAVYDFIIQNLPGSSTDRISETSNKKEITLVGDYWAAAFAWIPKEVLHQNLGYSKFYFNHESIESEKVLLVISEPFEEYIEKGRYKGEQVDIKADRDTLFRSAETLARFKDNASEYDVNKYPYSNMKENRKMDDIEIRANY